jgi:hypothetical protein
MSSWKSQRCDADPRACMLRDQGSRWKGVEGAWTRPERDRLGIRPSKRSAVVGFAGHCQALSVAGNIAPGHNQQQTPNRLQERRNETNSVMGLAAITSHQHTTVTGKERPALVHAISGHSTFSAETVWAFRILPKVGYLPGSLLPVSSTASARGVPGC